MYERTRTHAHAHLRIGTTGHGNLESDPGWGIAAWNVPINFASFYDDEALEREWYPRVRAYMEHWIKIANNNSGYFNIMKEGDWGNLYPGKCRLPEARVCKRASC